jgi:hypothetical protein
MSSRFERRRPATGEPAPPVPIRGDDRQIEGERPWQSLVRRLRRLMEAQGELPPAAGESTVKPALRVIPGGKASVAEDSPRVSNLSHGRWRT